MSAFTENARAFIAETGTTLTFWPSTEIFETVEFDYERFVQADKVHNVARQFMLPANSFPAPVDMT